MVMTVFSAHNLKEAITNPREPNSFSASARVIEVQEPCDFIDVAVFVEFKAMIDKACPRLCWILVQGFLLLARLLRDKGAVRLYDHKHKSQILYNTLSD